MNLRKISIFSFVFITVMMFLAGVGQNAVAYEEKLTPNSKASILMEYETGEILDENNSNEEMPIASVTKLMTILLVLENIENGNLPLDKKIVASDNAAGMGGSQVFIDAGSEYEVQNLLKAVIIASANDASVALSEEIAGSEEDFVVEMNKRAQELKLTNTNYVNCTGLPAPSAYSSAKDVALVFKEVLKHPLYFKYSGIWMEDFVHPSGRVTGMANTNKLVKFYDGCDAGKTGSTSEAGYCLATTAKRNNMRLISVVLGAKTGKDRFADSSNQLNYGFQNFQNVKVVNANENLAESVLLEKGDGNLILNPEEDFCFVCKKGEKLKAETTVQLPEKLQAPLHAGDVVGKIFVTQNGEVKKEINVIVKEDINSNGYFKTAQNIMKKW